jgi:hypothetical protein
MQQRKLSYHFETSKKSITTYLVVALLLTLFSQKSQAQIKCEALFIPSLSQRILAPLSAFNPFARKEQLVLSPEKIELLKELVQDSKYARPFGLRRGESEPLLIMMWHELKPEHRDLIFEILDDGPTEFSKFRSHFSKILERHKIESASSHSFLEHLLSNYADHLRFQTPVKKFSNWMQDNVAHFEARLNSGELNLQKLRSELQTALQMKLVSDKWQSQYGVNELPLIKDAQKNVFVQLKSGDTLPVKISSDGKTIKMLVPKSIISRAAWNPIYSEVLQAKIAAGTKPPEVYDGFLATNGLFYLTDGNHRFILDSREKVWIQMSNPAKTASMSISFDAIGLKQPSVEVLMNFFDGKLTLEDLIGGANAARITYR